MSLKNSFDEVHELIKNNRFSDADRILNESESLINSNRRDSQSAEFHYLRGVSAYSQNQVSIAVNEFRAALEIMPNHTDASICLSVLLNDIGKYDDAKLVFEQANKSVSSPGTTNSTIDKKFSIKHLEIADLYARYRRFREAIIEYQKAEELDPTNLDIRIRKSKSLAKGGEVSSALQELQSLVREYPRNTAVRIQLGLLHFSQGNVLDAELEWETAQEIDPSNSEIETCLEMAREKRIRL